MKKIIWLTKKFVPTDESNASMGKVLDGDNAYFILPKEKGVKQMTKINLNALRPKLNLNALRPRGVIDWGRIVSVLRLNSFPGHRGETGHRGGSLGRDEVASGVAAGKRAHEMGVTLIEKLAHGDGFSESLAGVSPKTGYMTATTDKTEKKIPIDKLRQRDIALYAVANHDALNKPDTYLGGWRDTDKKTGETSAYLDVSTNYQTLDEAVKVARNAKQIGIYDLEYGEWGRTIFVNDPSGRLYWEEGEEGSKVKRYLN